MTRFKQKFYALLVWLLQLAILAGGTIGAIYLASNVGGPASLIFFLTALPPCVMFAYKTAHLDAQVPAWVKTPIVYASALLVLMAVGFHAGELAGSGSQAQLYGWSAATLVIAALYVFFLYNKLLDLDNSSTQRS